jgi:hypothetical protein
MRNVARDVTVVVDGVVLHQFFILLILLDFLGYFPWEVDMIENHHLSGCQLQEFLFCFLIHAFKPLSGSDHQASSTPAPPQTYQESTPAAPPDS